MVRPWVLTRKHVEVRPWYGLKIRRETEITNSRALIAIGIYITTSKETLWSYCRRRCLWSWVGWKDLSQASFGGQREQKKLTPQPNYTCGSRAAGTCMVGLSVGTFSESSHSCSQA